MMQAKAVPAGRLSRAASTVHLQPPAARQLAEDLLQLGTGARTQTPLESDIARRMALVQKLKVLAAGEIKGSDELKEATRCLHDVLDATIASDDICAILARDEAAVKVLDDLARQRGSRMAEAQALALRVLVNVGSLKAGAAATADIGSMNTCLDQVRTLRMTSPQAQRDMGVVALRGICNLIAGTGGCCGAHVAASKVVTVTLTISRDSEELCENVCLALASIASIAEGASAIISARGHKAIFSSLLARGQTVSHFVKAFNSEDDAKRVSELQVHALWALRNLSSHPVGRERLSTDLPALVAVATIFTHCDDSRAVEHAAAMLANLVKTETGLHLAMAASTCNFMLNLLEIGLFIEDFTPGNHALCVLLNMLRSYECLEYCLEEQYYKPVGGLLKVQLGVGTACAWCDLELVLGVLANLTSHKYGYELVVLETDVESAVLQVIERHDEIRLKLLAIAVLRNTSASKRSLVRSSGMLVQFLVKQLDHASRKDIWSAADDERTIYIHALGLIQNISMTPSGALKLLSHDIMERHKGRNGILSNLADVIAAYDSPEDSTVDVARALGNLGLHAREEVQEEAVQHLLEAVTNDSHGFALQQAASDGLTKIVGQIKCHELVTKQRKRAQTGGKVDMASIGKAESGEHVTDELCYTIIHS